MSKKKQKKTSEEDSLEWAQKAYDKLKENKKIKFSWGEDKRPPVVDTEG